jgi:PadR family transcriptional regulator, regulatory protein PadR
MNKETIGELEELVLLAVGALYQDQAYALTILKLIDEETGRNMDVTALHSVLRRLEQKGFVKSTMGGATSERGGRRKRFFQLTQTGRSILEKVMEARMNLYNKLPRFTFSR